MFPKATTLLTLCAGLAFNTQAETLTVSGSTSASHIVEVLAETYSAQNQAIKLPYKGLGRLRALLPFKKALQN
ncbi:hypothetical protein [Photobacterium swingsii]|uniref:hypothetical protein n=1 Tax=Photobacterium swingsii TaxID=680026 RepID=UPI000AFD30FC